MAQTVANLANVLKDVWTSDRAAKQFYDENPLLEWFKEIEAETIGLQAQVPIFKWNTAGYTSTGPAGGVLNPATNAQTDQAIYTLVYHWMQISIETAALNQTGSSAQGIVKAKDFEMKSAISAVARQASRQLANNGDGLIAQCTTGGASTTVNLLPQASGGIGFDAIEKGWLYPGLIVDVGTAADSDSLATGSAVTDVGESPTAPTVTISNSITTTSSHFVSIANPNSATVTNTELNGLRNMVSDTTTLGGINPASAGEGFWKSKLDTASTSFSLDLALDLQQKIFNKGGAFQTAVITSPKQMANFYSLLQNQVRFTGEQGMGAGGVKGTVGLSWNGLGVNVWPDIVSKEWYMLTKEDFVRIVGAIKQPTWVTDLEGAGGDIRWGQGTTAFNSGLVFPFQVGMQRRNRSAAATALTA